MVGFLKVICNAFVQFKVAALEEKLPWPEVSMWLSNLAWSQVSAGHPDQALCL